MMTIEKIWEELRPQVWDGLAAVTESILDYLGAERVTVGPPEETIPVPSLRGLTIRFWHGRRPILDVYFWVHRTEQRQPEVLASLKAQTQKGEPIFGGRFKSAYLPDLTYLQKDLTWWMGINGPASAGQQIAQEVSKEALGPKAWTPRER